MIEETAEKLEIARIRALEFRTRMLERDIFRLLEKTKTDEGRDSIYEMSFFTKEAIDRANKCDIPSALKYLSNANFHAGIYKQAEKLSAEDDRYKEMVKILDRVLTEIKDILVSKCGCKSR